jgi:hypothetical protein
MTREDLARRYEDLRAFVAGHPIGDLPHGLGILLQEGLLAWCAAQASAAKGAPACSDGDGRGMPPPSPPMVDLLASIIMNLLGGGLGA